MPPPPSAGRTWKPGTSKVGTTGNAESTSAPGTPGTPAQLRAQYNRCHIHYLLFSKSSCANRALNRLILHDVAPPAPGARIFITSVKKSGMTEAMVASLKMTEDTRSLPVKLAIYNPPGLFHVLAKIETECSHSEAQTAANVLSTAIFGQLKAGLSVEDSVSSTVHMYPGHVQHGVLYQLKSLPEKRTLQRFDRQAFFVSESDDVGNAVTDKENSGQVPGAVGTFHASLPYPTRHVAGNCARGNKRNRRTTRHCSPSRAFEGELEGEVHGRDREGIWHTKHEGAQRREGEEPYGDAHVL